MSTRLVLQLTKAFFFHILVEKISHCYHFIELKFVYILDCINQFYHYIVLAKRKIKANIQTNKHNTIT